MNSYDIAVIGGDGTGPEVTQENIKVLEAAAQKFNFKLQKKLSRFYIYLLILDEKQKIRKIICEVHAQVRQKLPHSKAAHHTRSNPALKQN